MSVIELVRHAESLLDSGLLTKHDESFVSTVVTKFQRMHALDGHEVSRLREIIDANL